LTSSCPFIVRDWPQPIFGFEFAPHISFTDSIQTTCLTLPQAACGLSSFNLDRKLDLAVTLVWATAYRSVLCNCDLGRALARLTGSPSLTEAFHTSDSRRLNRKVATNQLG
jgi:hypothetical protein